MPLVKSARTPEASAPAAAPVTSTPAPAAAPAAQAASVIKSAISRNEMRHSKFGDPLTDYELESYRGMDAREAYSAALQSVGVVQHGGKTFEDYLARVKQAALASLAFLAEYKTQK